MTDLFPDVDFVGALKASPLEVKVAITLTQPWATLMALGVKVNETRSWPTHYRGWIGIHAAKGFPGDCRDLCMSTPFAETLRAADIASWKNLPTACLLGVTRLVACVRTETVRGRIPALELAFGDYSDGRFAFKTEGFRKLREPIPMKGALSIWRMPRVVTEGDLL